MSSSTTEGENYDRLGDLIINLGTTTLRNVFHRRYKNLTNLEWGQSPVTPTKFFKSGVFISPQERKLSFDKMSKDEILKIHDVSLWDVTLLFKVLNSIDFSKNSKSPELLNAQSIENIHITDFKNVRNNYYGHVSKKEIPDKQFNEAWKKAEKALQALGVTLNDIKLVKESKIVKKFKTCDLPTPNFTGRKDLLAQIHYQLQKCATQKEITQRIVVLRGIGGIGKSELARTYAHTYSQDPIIQNVAWINAERLTGLKSSFVRLANSLKLSTKGMEIEEILQIVYQHFSDHIGTGLFIFDNSQLMNDKPFGIYEYLPTQSFDRPPLILITARDKTWEIPKENIIAINQLSQAESVDFLTKKFRLRTGTVEHTENDKNAIKKLADFLQGYPLGLALATSNIASEEFVDLSVEIEGYIERMKEPDGDWLDDEQTGAATTYKPVMSNVWKGTLEKIKSMKNIGPSSLEVLNVMAYLMPDTTTIQQVQLIFQRQLQKELSILEKFSLISIHTGPWVDEAIGGIRIHRIFQLYTRKTLDIQNNFSALMLNCENVSKRGLQKDTSKLYGVDEKGTMLSLHEFLKQRQWPCNSILYSVIFCSMSCLEDASVAFKIAIDVFEFLGLDQKNYLEDNEAQTEQNTNDVLNLFYLCVFWINRRQCYGNKMRENSNLSQKILLKALSSNVPPAIEHALCFKSGLTLAQEHSNKLCFEFLKQFKTLHMEARRNIKKTQSIVQTVTDIPTSNIGNIVYAYRLLWECFKTAETPQHSVATMETVLQKHFQVYSTLDKLNASDREHQLQLYWAEGGPLHQIKTLKRSNEEGRRMMLDSFFKNNGVQCIVHNLQFLSQYSMSYVSHNTDILQVSEEEEVAFVYYFTRKLVYWGYSDHLLHYVPFTEALLEYTKVLCQPERGYYTFQLFCLLTWFALFAKNENNDAGLIDGRISMCSVDSELQTLLMQIKKSIQGDLPSSSNLSRLKTRSNRLVLQTFLNTYKNAPDSLAVQTAASFLLLLNQNYETSSESEIDQQEVLVLETDCADVRSLRALEHEETNAIKGLNLLAYLPRLPIELIKLNRIFKFCFQSEIFKDDISLLELNGLIFVDKKYGTIVENTCMTINKVSQHCARERLQLRSDPSYLIRICEYITQEGLKTRQGDKQTMIGLHKHLKKIMWPQKSLRFSLIFCSLLIGKLETSNAAFPIVHHVFHSCLSDARLKKVILSDPDTKQLFLLCVYWVKLAKYYCWHNTVKSENLNVSMSLLEKNFFAFILLSVEILTVPKPGLTDLQKHAYWLCRSIVSNIYTVNKKITDKDFMNKLTSAVLSAVNLTTILDPNKLWNVFHFLRNFCFSRNVNTCTATRFFGVITDLILSSYPASLSDKTEKKIRLEKNVGNMYQQPTINSLYVKDVIAICEGPTYRKRNQFLDLFFEKRGYLILASHFTWLNQSGETFGGNTILSFIQKLSFDWNYAQNLRDAEEFMNEFCSYTKTLASHQTDIKNRHDILHDEKISIQFNCLMSWFAMYANPSGWDYKRGSNLLLAVASQLNIMLDNILQLGWDWNDDYIKRPEYKSYVRKDILHTFLESHCNNQLMCVAVKTAESLLEYLDEYVESSADEDDEV